MRNCTKFYIDGAWVDPLPGGRTMECVNPATERVSGTVALGTAADAARVIEAADRAFAAFAGIPAAGRADLLRAVAAVYERRIEEVADAVTLEMGAPRVQLARPAQAMLGLAHLHIAADLAGRYAFERPLGDSTTIVKEPVGVASLITPWNWPLNQIACKVAPALAAGCTVVLKPSELAPYSAWILAEILHEAGVPAGVFNMIYADGAEVGPTLATHPAVAMVSLTGSTAAGAAVARAAADGIKRVSLELGGKSANIILPGADLRRAVTHGVLTLMSNAGQSCNAPSRMLVPAAVLDEVEVLAAEVCARLVVGDPTAPDTAMGPVANRRQFERVQDHIRSGIAEGARLVCGGPGRPEGLDAGFYCRPTVFSRVTDGMGIARQEIFGPVLAIRPYETVEEAIASANDSDYGLSGYVYGATPEEAGRVARRLRTGMVHLNGSRGDLTAPFGGYKQSGLGREWGEWGLEEFLETKAIMAGEPLPGL